MLGSSDVLKLTFTVAEKENDKGVQPHQTFLRFYDETTGEEGIQPIRVSPAGKAKFELVRNPRYPSSGCWSLTATFFLFFIFWPAQNMARPPTSLPPTGEAPLRVTLLLGSFAHISAKFELFELIVPPSQAAPQHPDEASFHLLPEIQHTFRPEPKTPPRFISAIFSALVLAPWVVLLGLVRIFLSLSFSGTC